MNVKEILKRAFITRHCVLCKDLIPYDSEEPFCEYCIPEWLENLDIMCSDCGFDSENCICLPEKVREVARSIAGFGVFYTPNFPTPANRIVYKLKREYSFEVINFCAETIYKKAKKLCANHKVKCDNYIVTFPPRRKLSVVKYGYDHARLLAKSFADKMGLELVELFENSGSKEQKALTKSDRLSNAAESFGLLDDIDVKGKGIFLIDDVMTSGATINVCARLLYLQGAKDVIPLTFAKDMKKF